MSDQLFYTDATTDQRHSDFADARGDGNIAPWVWVSGIIVSAFVIGGFFNFAFGG